MDHHDHTTAGDERSGAADRDLESLERTLTERGEPYARATVVRREPPVSATVGDRALVTVDGEVVGWIGGVACAQSAVEREARNAIEDGDARLVGLAPDPDDVDRPGLEAHPMTCHGEGTLEVFVEPVVPPTRLLVVGGSPIARSLVRLAEELSLEVVLVDPDAAAPELPEGTTIMRTLEPAEIADAAGRVPLVVVASMGAYDAQGVAAGVLAEAPYVGLVASEKRASAVAERAAERLERDPESVAEAVTSPAGIDVGARTPAEIAVSLLAELVAVRADADRPTDAGGFCGETDDGTEETAVDPVCGMTVDPDDAAATVTHEGEPYHFCCHGCADAFRDEPGAYLTNDGDPMEAQ